MPKTADNFVQVTIEATWSTTRNIATVLGAQVTAGGDPDPREDAVVEAAEVILAAWKAEIVPNLPNNYTLVGARYLDYDSTSGVTGFVPPVGGGSNSGGSASVSMPPSVNVLVTKVIAGAGRAARNGRIYLPAPFESVIDEDGVVTPSQVTQTNADFASFAVLTGIVGAQATLPIGFEMIAATVAWPTMIVPGTVPPKRIVDPDGVGTVNLISSYATQTLAATQRRRLRS